MSQVNLVEKLFVKKKEVALIKKLGRSQLAISVFNTCSEMTTCHYDEVFDVCAACGELQLMDMLLVSH